MKPVPTTMMRSTSMLLHLLGLPLFFMLFVLIYRSAWMTEWLSAGGDHLTLNILMVTCILLGSIALSRITMRVLWRQVKLTPILYALWTIAEVTFSCLFIGLYLTLMEHGEQSYFVVVGRSIALLTGVLIYPYAIINLITYHLSSYTSTSETTDAAQLVRFYDRSKRLKLVLAYDALLYVQADENYVSIHYCDGDRVKSYSLRSSMNAMEELLVRHGILRCHRSYLINPKHIKLLGKNKEGIVVAELDMPEAQSVPVSASYYDEVIKHL